jgi:hypothetical protein
MIDWSALDWGDFLAPLAAYIFCVACAELAVAFFGFSADKGGGDDDGRDA